MNEILTGNHAVETSPGDIWIMVDTGSAVPAKYLSSFVTAKFPYGINGPAEAVCRFNLTAYVRDMIKEALSPPNTPSGSD